MPPERRLNHGAIKERLPELLSERGDGDKHELKADGTVTREEE